MIVMKFGGTSVGSAERMEQVVELVAGLAATRPSPVVVLSAMSGVTNALIAGAELAVQRNLDGALGQVELVREKHLQAVKSLFGDSEIARNLSHDIDGRLADLEILYKGVSYLGELTKRSLDTVSGLGEILSSRIVVELANLRGLKSQWADARQIVITDDNFGKASPIWAEVEQRAKNAYRRCVQNGDALITQGFIGATISGANTTLGRGGSDFSASIFGVALDAAEIQIWTDVDGMMTADPRIVPAARVLPEVSFQEASELAYFGAKVLHPLTIKPAVEKSIPVRILNTMHPDKPGTLIKPTVKVDTGIRAVASKKDITAIFINSPKMLMSHGFLARVFEVFDKHQTPIDLISTSEISVALTIDQADKLKAIVDELSVHGDVQTLSDAAIVTVVGAQFREQLGIAGSVFNALRNINILMISGGASDINLSFVVAKSDADKAVRELHDTFFS